MTRKVEEMRLTLALSFYLDRELDAIDAHASHAFFEVEYVHASRDSDYGKGVVVKLAGGQASGRNY